MKTYYLKFGSGDLANFSGLFPTFTIFDSFGVTLLVPAPGVTETPPTSGLYSFMYAPTLSILFKVDGGANLAATDRYIYGSLDPLQSVDEKIGNITDSFGSTGIDPSTILGYLKRNQEFEEGNAIFTKASALWSISSRGSSVLLAVKQLTNNTTIAGKS